MAIYSVTLVLCLLTVVHAAKKAPIEAGIDVLAQVQTLNKEVTS